MSVIRSTFKSMTGLVLSLAGGCGGGWAMAVPPDVAESTEELAIAERSSFSGALADEAFKLGGYRVAEVDRKWNSTSSSSVFGFSDSRTQGGYAYKLVASNQTLPGACATEQREQAQDLGDGAEFSSLIAKLGCSCGAEQNRVVLVLEASTTNQYAGTVRGADYTYQISALTERENGRMKSRDPLGYRVDGEGPIGAVGVVKPGRVWLDKQLPEPRRRELTCLLAGLLLYEPPQDR